MDIETELANFLGERQRLVDAITAEFRAGTSASAIARTVAPAFGRDVVKEYLAAVDRGDRTRTALAEAGLTGLVDVRVRGIDPPREATLAASVDPAEVEDAAGLPGRLRAALTPFHLSLTPLGGDDTDAGEVDRLLGDGEAVRVVRTRPRT